MMTGIAKANKSGWMVFLACIITVYLCFMALNILVITAAIFIPLTFISGVAVKCSASGVAQTREYLADACSAQWTRNPNALASALRSTADQKESIPLRASLVMPLFLVATVNVTTKQKIDRMIGYLLSSHPPLKTRILLLDQMAGFTTDGARPTRLPRREYVRRGLVIIIPIVLIAVTTAMFPWRLENSASWFPAPSRVVLQMRPVATVNVRAARGRAAPSKVAPTMYDLPFDTRVMVIDTLKAEGTEWYQVELQSGDRVWVASELITIRGR